MEKFIKKELSDFDSKKNLSICNKSIEEEQMESMININKEINNKREYILKVFSKIHGSILFDGDDFLNRIIQKDINNIYNELAKLSEMLDFESELLKQSLKINNKKTDK